MRAAAGRLGHLVHFPEQAHGPGSRSGRQLARGGRRARRGVKVGALGPGPPPVRAPGTHPRLLPLLLGGRGWPQGCRGTGGRTRPWTLRGPVRRWIDVHGAEPDGPLVRGTGLRRSRAASIQASDRRLSRPKRRGNQNQHEIQQQPTVSSTGGIHQGEWRQLAHAHPLTSWGFIC